MSKPTLGKRRKLKKKQKRYRPWTVEKRTTQSYWDPAGSGRLRQGGRSVLYWEDDAGSLSTEPNGTLLLGFSLNYIVAWQLI